MTNGLPYYMALRKAGIPAAMHIYPTGGHGFGFRTSFAYHDLMVDELTTWLENLKLPKSGAHRVACIGNSITEGVLHADKAKTAPPVFAAEYAGRMLGADVNYRNCGRSGATTVDFLPAREADFKRVERAVGELQAISYEPIVFSIMLGTNDSASSGPLGAPVSNEDYKRNLLTIIGRLRENVSRRDLRATASHLVQPQHLQRGHVSGGGAEAPAGLCQRADRLGRQQRRHISGRFQEFRIFPR